MKKLLLFLFISSFFLSCPALMKRWTHGFKIAKLAVDLPYNPAWEVPPLPEKEWRALLSLLSQPFFYLDRGSQAYVFESGDHQWILKLFRHEKRSIFTKKKISEVKVDRLLRASKIAFEKGADLTGLVYVHLNPAPYPIPTVQLTDRRGQTHTLDLDRYRFAIQRKGQPVREAFRKAFERKEVQEIERLIDSFLRLLKERTGRLIVNGDYSVSTNFGFLEGKAIEWDFGHYREDLALASARSQRREMERFVVQFGHFLEKEAPEWLPHYQRRAEALMP